MYLFFVRCSGWSYSIKAAWTLCSSMLVELMACLFICEDVHTGLASVRHQMVFRLDMCIYFMFLIATEYITHGRSEGTQNCKLLILPRNPM